MRREFLPDKALDGVQQNLLVGAHREVDHAPG